MTQDQNFHHIMIASMNDMKQSINLLQHKLEQIPLVQDNKGIDKSDVNLMHYEISRMQNSIAQLHNLYLLKNDELPLQLTESYFIDVIEEQVIAHDVLCKRMGVAIEIRGDNSVSGYVDDHLLSQVLDIAIVNAIRYTKDAIVITVGQSADGITLTIDDNGLGYPEASLSRFVEVTKQQDLSGLTNQALAWYYCYLVASMHKNRAIKGWVSLSNKSELGGSRFEIFFP